MTIPATQSEIATIAALTASTDAQRLNLMKLAREQLVFAIYNNESLTYLEIRNRRAQFADPVAELKYLDAAISTLESEVALAAGGSQRTKAVFVRR